MRPFRHHGCILLVYLAGALAIMFIRAVAVRVEHLRMDRAKEICYESWDRATQWLPYVYCFKR